MNVTFIIFTTWIFLSNTEGTSEEDNAIFNGLETDSLSIHPFRRHNLTDLEVEEMEINSGNLHGQDFSATFPDTWKNFVDRADHLGNQLSNTNKYINPKFKNTIEQRSKNRRDKQVKHAQNNLDITSVPSRNVKGNKKNVQQKEDSAVPSWQSKGQRSTPIGSYLNLNYSPEGPCSLNTESDILDIYS
ncbi:hypothetical protein Mgra_00009605 [Meloidogyne graminicola]|uniref:Uncharacterized protein n=1 Tax=Meloidogyne graminicola TaxID=189291 RepID=A0A8S9ZD19_9BILA|nr:hypothetical protein Mgra_00009605 [Meloidogyne graminicola]